jgi:hypothetical protein
VASKRRELKCNRGTLVGRPQVYAKDTTFSVSFREMIRLTRAWHPRAEELFGLTSTSDPTAFHLRLRRIDLADLRPLKPARYGRCPYRAVVFAGLTYFKEASCKSNPLNFNSCSKP